MANRHSLPDVRRERFGALTPFREMNRLQRSINRLFEDFLLEPFHSLQRGMFEPFSLEEERAAFLPPCDIQEADDRFVLSFDLPGVKKDDVKIDLQDHELRISGERKEESKGKGSRERFYGSFYRTFTLPSNVDEGKIEAFFENGVLELSIPKAQAAPGKKISVREGKTLESKESKQQVKPEKAA